MPNRLKLTGILTPPSDDAFKPGVGYVRFDPADERAVHWAVPGYRPAWPIVGVPNALGAALQEVNGGDMFVPGDEPGDAYAGPSMRVSYELQTTSGTWHRGTYLWRAVSTGGGVIDIRTPAPEQEPPTVERPGVPAGALLTTDVGNLVPSKAEFDGARTPLADPGLPGVTFHTGDDYFAPFNIQRVGPMIRTPHTITQAITFDMDCPVAGHISDSFASARLTPPAGWTLLITGASAMTFAQDGIPRAASVPFPDVVAVATRFGNQRVFVAFILQRL